MTTADKIALIAAIAAVVSVAIAVLAFLVTKRTAQHANELMAQQLRLAKVQDQRQTEKEVNASRPIIDWKGGGDYSPFGGTSRWHFRNLGGTVTSLRITTGAEKISAMINPTNIRNTLVTNDEGDVIFQFEKGPMPLSPVLPLNFSLFYETRLGEHWEKKFKLIGDKNPIGVAIPGRVAEA